MHNSLEAVSAEPSPADIEVPCAIAERVASLVRDLGRDLESAVYFEHPFTPPGLLLLVRDGVESFPDLLARVYRALPSGLKIACLRRRELFELALPGFAAPPLGIDEQPHLAHCVKFRSALLHGADCRPEVPLPADPGLFLRAHIRACRRFFRSHAILALLVRRRHQALVEEIAAESRRLMSIALAGDQGWEVDLDGVPACFAARYGIGEAMAVWERLAVLEAGAAEASREQAEEAGWLFERFLTLLEREAP
jgi:hypothetical protein